MKRRDLIKHLTTCGCFLVREGHSHSIYENSLTAVRAPVPHIGQLTPQIFETRLPPRDDSNEFGLR